jgi:hypothetical protein
MITRKDLSPFFLFTGIWIDCVAAAAAWSSSTAVPLAGIEPQLPGFALAQPGFTPPHRLELPPSPVVTISKVTTYSPPTPTFYIASPPQSGAAAGLALRTAAPTQMCLHRRSRLQVDYEVALRQTALVKNL